MRQDHRGCGQRHTVAPPHSTPPSPPPLCHPLRHQPFLRHLRHGREGLRGATAVPAPSTLSTAAARSGRPRTSGWVGMGGRRWQRQVAVSPIDHHRHGRRRVTPRWARGEGGGVGRVCALFLAATTAPARRGCDGSAGAGDRRWHRRHRCRPVPPPPPPTWEGYAVPRLRGRPPLIGGHPPDVSAPPACPRPWRGGGAQRTCG